MTQTRSDFDPIDISDWIEEERVYPQGKREKRLLRSPPDCTSPLIPNHRYIFKQSPAWAVEQYWTEIIAYHFGRMIHVPVPPAFVAFDHKQNISGALIEWFLQEETETIKTEFTPGGAYMQQYISDFDRTRGKQHNFQTLAKIMSDLNIEEWLSFWAKVLIFDALIGNIDRHQDNWGTITTTEKNSQQIQVSMAPAFDNGSSLGGENRLENLEKFKDSKIMLNYIKKGKHHMRWTRDSEPLNHCELLEKIAEQYSETKRIFASILAIELGPMEDVLHKFTLDHVPEPLSKERAEFMLQLLQARRHDLLEHLG